MITLIRWLRLKSKETKCKLAFWQFMEQLLAEAMDQPEDTTPKTGRPLKNILFFNIEFLMHAKNPPVLNGLMDFL